MEPPALAAPNAWVGPGHEVFLSYARTDLVHASRLHALLAAFAHETGCPVLVNTSFNDREPIVDSPAHALATYGRTAIDALVLEDRLLVKR